MYGIHVALGEESLYEYDRIKTTYLLTEFFVKEF